MQDKNGLELGTAQRGTPGRSVLVKNTTAADMATLRDTFGYKKVIITSWEAATNRIAFEFAYHYYGAQDCDWVADEIGGIFVINDDFWGFDRIMEITRLQPPKTKVFAWYDHIMEEEYPLRLKAFLALKKKKS